MKVHEGTELQDAKPDEIQSKDNTEQQEPKVVLFYWK